MELLRKVCPCGEAIWEVKSPAHLPRYTEWIVCARCGTDHSRNPPLRLRWRYGVYTLRRRRLLYGSLQRALRFGLYNSNGYKSPGGSFLEALSLGLVDAFLLPRERKALLKENTIGHSKDGEEEDHTNSVQQPASTGELPEMWRVPVDGSTAGIF